MKKLILILATLSLSACGFEIVDTGYRGVQRSMGEVVGEPLPEGLHFYNPFTGSITEINVREYNFKTKTEAFTKDNQAVQMDVELVWSIDPKSVNKLFKEVGREDDIENVRVRNNFLGSLKDAIGRQDADTIIQNRDKAAGLALEETRKKFAPMGIMAHSLNLSNMSLNRDYQHAVEQKMIEKQKAEKAIFETRRITEVAKQTVETAKADAEAMRIKSQALAQNKGLVEFELAKKWDGKLPVWMTGNSVPMINIQQLNKPTVLHGGGGGGN